MVEVAESLVVVYSSSVVGVEVDDSWGRTEMVSLDIVIVVMIPSGSTVVMTVGEEETVEDVMSVTGYNVSVVDEPSGLTLVIVMAPSVLIGKLVIEDASVEDVSVEGDTVEVNRTLSVTDDVVVMVAVSEVVLTTVVVSSTVLVVINVVVVGLK